MVPRQRAARKTHRKVLSVPVAGFLAAGWELSQCCSGQGLGFLLLFNLLIPCLPVLHKTQSNEPQKKQALRAI